MRRGQISFDFLAITVFAFIIFLEMFEVYTIEINSARIVEGRASALRVGSSVSRTINEVLKKNGTNALITIPESLDTGDTYYLSITASGRRVDIFWPISTQNKSIGTAILTNNITQSNISKSVGSGGTSLNITNLDGFVSVSGICGNGVCDSWGGENCQTCTADCGCSGGMTCYSGVCGFCSSGLTFCSGSCVDTTSDTSNCGGCGIACGDSQLCCTSQCKTICYSSDDCPSTECLACSCISGGNCNAHCSCHPVPGCGKGEGLP